ncbi:HAD-IA family hydrolase [Actinoalloteichus caeruleus]|uniref:Sugar-phosphatase n=1 Tax=Actinoalloteichus caeruleus DSM 43889 TaxID=1120930 RepID=A0ABT1JCD2_ACTCY|nr:HAD-IA family hydrolase [Actinoalloteichus caeruleus]MCP2330158.1 sugar-phosphatase [Actinoalloteichus caeruleus DSM 43889]
MTHRIWEMTGVDAILFDLDGVLVNSARAIDVAMRRWAVERGLDPDAIASLAHGRRDEDLVRLAAPHLDVDPEVDRIAELDFEVMDQVTAIPGASALIGLLPPLRWAVVTSGAASIASARLAAAGLSRPPVVVTAEQVAKGKPDPEGYLLAAERLGVEPTRCVVLEDAPVGWDAATAAGMRCVGVGWELARSRPELAAWVEDLSPVRVTEEPSGLRLTGRSPAPATAGRAED